MRLRRKGLLRYGKYTTYYIILFVISIFIGVGYSYLNSNLGITGYSTIKNASWDVHFSNVNVQSGSVENGTYEITGNSTVLNFQASLDEPGNYYNFTVDVNNTGTIDAMLGSLVNTGLSTEQAKYLEYTVTYSDGTEIKEKDLIGAATAETLLVKVKYKDDVAESDLPTDDQTINLQLNMTYIQADDTAVVINHPVCRRATTLHTSGSTTYGNLGTKGTLSAGDAFDCDVNKDGAYDAETERFYYITPLDTNNDYVVLFYYNNVAQGIPNSTYMYPYNNISNYSDNTYYGPNDGITQLPTTSQWKNVKLASTTRNIKDETGTVRVNNFSYEGYAARLLTYQEAIAVCGTTSIGNNKYLLENTSEAYWLENPSSSDRKVIWVISTRVSSSITTSNSLLGSGYSGNNTGSSIRPVIEVPKSKISY